MLVQKEWKIKKPEINNELLECCEGNRVLACLLSNRGINTKEKIIDFLNPFKAKLSDPDVFCDMQKAYERVQKAIEKKEHITIYGDFDADGVTSTALLYLTLKEIGADVDYYLPDRTTESHGLNTKALVKLISKHKSKLIITVDCGISNVEEVRFAKGFNIDVIITDHHEAPEILPESFGILNPKASNSIDPNLCIDEIQSLNYLAGVGVAFKFACKLLQEYKKSDFIQKIIPLAAVGTIGDVVELIGENRSIVATGIELIKKNSHKGVTKLLLASDIKDINTINSETIAFYVVPKLNAAGRLESPETSIRFFITEDEEELDSLVKKLCDLNAERQKLCDDTFSQAEEMYLKNYTQNKQSIVLLSPDWHIGIIGIVASKLVEKYNKPVFLMTKDPNIPNIIRCSCRSIPDINIHSVLSVHKELFEGFGGHKMAAGLSFDENKISFEMFKEKLTQTIKEFAVNVDFSKTQVDVDMELEPCDITIENVKIIDKLQPFGSGNPSPVFVINNAILKNFRFMGQENNHLKLFVAKDNEKTFECVKWNCPDFNVPVNTPIDILFSMKLNSFNNEVNVQLMLEDLHSDYIKTNNLQTQIKIVDHRNKVNIINQVLDFIQSTKKQTAVFIENPALVKKLNIPETVIPKTFSRDNIPSNIEQLMFFDSPASFEDFKTIITDTGANLVHFMNFNSLLIDTDSLISKLSGMLKYAISNLDGNIELIRISKALGVTCEIVECALDLFDEVKMTDLNKVNDDNFKITTIHPVELSKIKECDTYNDLTVMINEVNKFKEFYLNSSVEDIKTSLEV